jgi:UDPglucose 6-dehydrogenase
MSQIAVIGTGYVGLVSGAILSDFGHTVTCVDIDEDKINGLKNGIIPIFEPGLERIVKNNYYYKRLDFTTDIQLAVENNDIIFIAVGTPPVEDGSADLQYVFAAAQKIAACMNGFKVIVNKSTVPVGTGRKVQAVMQTVLTGRRVDYHFDVVSNPEFLREGSAIQDFMHPDRVVIGADSERAINMMKEVYRVLYINETPFIETNIETAEMIKYASNAFLAMKITFINEVANVCEKVGADVQKVAKAMGRDGRIAPKFLHAGPGFGGSCFPKDTRALVKIARDCGEAMSLVETTVMANDRQKMKMVQKILDAMGEIAGKTFAILGVTFKPNTDDLREAPALVILPELVKRGAKLKVYDPAGRKEGAWRFSEISESITWCENTYEALENTDATVVLTEWNEFRNINFDKYKQIGASEYFFDLRNVYDKKMMLEKGFKYYGVGV